MVSVLEKLRIHITISNTLCICYPMVIKLHEVTSLSLSLYFFSQWSTSSLHVTSSDVSWSQLSASIDRSTLRVLLDSCTISSCVRVCVGEWVSEWASEWEWESEWQCVCVCASECISECISECVCVCVCVCVCMCVRVHHVCMDSLRAWVQVCVHWTSFQATTIYRRWF